MSDAAAADDRAPGAPEGLLGATAHVRDVRAATRSVEVIASTDALDSHGTVLDQGSWKLDRFQRNPVVLYGHNSWNLPIGYASDARVEGGALTMRLNFAPGEANPRAEQVWRLVQHGTLRAVSVGFFAGRAEVKAGGDVVVLRDNELLEVSVVPIPSNPEAVAKMRARAMESRVDEAADDKTKQGHDAVEAEKGYGGSAAAEEIPVVVDEAAVRALAAEPASADVAVRTLAAEDLAAVEGLDQVGELRGLLDNAEKSLAAAVAERDAARAELAQARAAAAKATERAERGELYLRHAAKITPAYRAALDGLPLATAASLLDVAPTVRALDASAAPAQPGNGDASGAPTAPVTLDGKRWEDMAPVAKHNLRFAQPALYEALRADWKARGEPAAPPPAAAKAAG